jgi:hypothetical protein
MLTTGGTLLAVTGSNYPYISKKSFVSIGEMSLELYGDVTSYLEKLKK